tara:strand:- start:1274 stop:2506 length:1233 start_codon:yes stop_codon:yes gene_type:complete
MNTINKLLIGPLNDLSADVFRSKFNSLTKSNKKKLIELVIFKKFSPVFLDYVQKNDLINLFDKSDFQGILNQSKRYQLQAFETIREVIFLDQLFKKNKLNPIFLKGVAVMGEYSDIANRPSVDIDILFPKNELYQAYMILIKNEYNGAFINQSEEEVFNYCKKRHHLPVLVGKSNISIELHHRITRPMDFVECPLSESVFNNKRILNFYDQEIFIPSIDDLLQHLLVHFSLNSDFNVGLKVVSDIRILEKKYCIDWVTIFKKIDNRKILKSSALSLATINNHFKLNSDLKSLKKVFEDIKLTDEFTLIVFQKMISQENEYISSKSFYEINRKDAASNFRKFFKKLFLNKYDIIGYYKISNPNFLNLFLFRIISAFERMKKYSSFFLKYFFIKDESIKKLNESRKIQEWLN